jgi:hypothetical protein
MPTKAEYINEEVRFIDDWLDEKESGLTNQQRKILVACSDRLIDLRDLQTIPPAITPLDAVERMRQGIIDGTLDADQTILTVLYAKQHSKSVEPENYERRIRDLLEENKMLDKELERYEKLTDAITLAVHNFTHREKDL